MVEADLAAAGFRATPGHLRLRSGQPVAGEPLGTVEESAYGPLLARACLGLWGHEQVDPARPLPSDGSVVLGLRENGQYVGWS